MNVVCRRYIRLVQTSRIFQAYGLQCTENSGGPGEALADRCRKWLFSMFVRVVKTLGKVVSARRRSRKCSCDWRAMGCAEAQQLGHVRMAAGVKGARRRSKSRVSRWPWADSVALASGTLRQETGEQRRASWRALVGSWGCFFAAMLPLRRRGLLGCIETADLAASRADESRVVEPAADVIQPDCRHVAHGGDHGDCYQRVESATAIRTVTALKPKERTADAARAFQPTSAPSTHLSSRVDQFAPLPTTLRL